MLITARLKKIAHPLESLGVSEFFKTFLDNSGGLWVGALGRENQEN